MTVLIAGAVCAAPGLAGSPQPGSSLMPIVVTPEAVISVPVKWQAGIVSDGSSLWVLATAPGTCGLCSKGTAVVRIDPATDAIAASVDLGTSDEIDFMASGGGALWVADFDASTVLKLDPVSLAVLDTIAVGPNPEGLAYGDGFLWVAEHRGGTVSRIDAATDTVVDRVTVGRTGASGPLQLGLGDGSVWVGVPNEAQVVRIDRQTAQVQARIALPGTSEPFGAGFGFAADAVWGYVCAASCLVTRVDPATNTIVATLELGSQADDPTMIDGAPWVARTPLGDQPGMLVRIDPATNSVDRLVSPAPDFSDGDLVFAADSWWLSDAAHHRILRLPASALGG